VTKGLVMNIPGVSTMAGKYSRTRHRLQTLWRDQGPIVIM
jgi:hypothetical protein